MRSRQPGAEVAVAAARGRRRSRGAGAAETAGGNAVSRAGSRVRGCGAEMPQRVGIGPGFIVQWGMAAVAIGQLEPRQHHGRPPAVQLANGSSSNSTKRMERAPRTTTV